jgi:hypothetical protein
LGKESDLRTLVDKGSTVGIKSDIPLGMAFGLTELQTMMATILLLLRTGMLG